MTTRTSPRSTFRVTSRNTRFDIEAFLDAFDLNQTHAELRFGPARNARSAKSFAALCDDLHTDRHSCSIESDGNRYRREASERPRTQEMRVAHRRRISEPRRRTAIRQHRTLKEAFRARPRSVNAARAPFGSRPHPADCPSAINFSARAYPETRWTSGSKTAEASYAAIVCQFSSTLSTSEGSERSIRVAPCRDKDAQVHDRSPHKPADRTDPCDSRAHR